MIIAIDGYDGTGKTTLAKNLAEKYGFFYLYKPVIKMYQLQNQISYDDSSKLVGEIEKNLFSDRINNKKKIANFYCNVLLWLKNHKDDINIVLDRGLLTTYAVIGDSDTEEVFDYYIKNGAFLDGSIYLTADDNERVNRIYKNNPNDPDLKYPRKWRDNNLEEYATSRNLNFHKISTDGKTPEEVLEEAEKYIYPELQKQIEQKNKFIEYVHSQVPDYER